jgi:N-acetylneuraminate synthase
LLKKIASTGKPVIMSTGASTLSEISESVAVLKEYGCKDLVLLKCTSTYPASAENTNLRSIPYLAEIFKCFAGLSDHTLGIGAALASVSLGACVIEKHFTLSRQDGGGDSAFSIEPNELKLLVEESERAWKALGQVKFEVLDAENASLQFKRSLYVVEDIKEGEKFTPENTRVIRPGDGLPPKYYENILGKTAKVDIERATALTWDLL